MKFEINQNEIVLTQEVTQKSPSGETEIVSSRWSFTKDAFNKQMGDFQPLPQNVIEWANS